jgi:hypothetical protein
MKLEVAWPAQPFDVERFVVIFVVHFDVASAAALTWLRHQQADISSMAGTRTRVRSCRLLGGKSVDDPPLRHVRAMTGATVPLARIVSRAKTL